MSAEPPADRLRLAARMQAEGLALQRRNLERRFPEASPAEIDARLDAWLLEREPDAPGEVVAWPRHRPVR